MSQPVNSSRLTNSTVNINGAANISTNYALASIGVTGNNFDISALSTGNNISIGANGTRNVTIGSVTSGTVTFPGVTTFTTPINGGVFTGTAVNGTTVTTALTIGGNLTGGSVSIAATANANTVTIGNNSTTGTGIVNVGTGSATVNIGNNATTSSTAIVLGRSTGSVTLGPALTLGTTPTTFSQLGGSTGSAAITTTVPLNGSASLSSTILPVGAWILTGYTTFPNSVTYSSLSISSTNNSVDGTAMSLVTATGLLVLSINRYVIVNSGTQTWYLVAGSAGSAQTVSNVGFTAVRIG